MPSVGARVMAIHRVHYSLHAPVKIYGGDASHWLCTLIVPRPEANTIYS